MTGIFSFLNELKGLVKAYRISHGTFKLGPTPLASISSFAIRLNEFQTSCQSGFYTDCSYVCEDCDGWVNTKPRRPLTTSAVLYGSCILRQWNDLCKHLAYYVRPVELRLNVLCDVDCYGTGQWFTQPMYQLPQLVACSSRLSTSSDPWLSLLAETTTRQLTGRSAPLSIDPLPHLPREVQVRILEYTDLIAPQDIEFVPETGFLCRNRSFSRVGCDDPPKLSTLNPCSACTFIHKPCYQLKKPSGSLASSRACWRFPFELFLVSREWRSEALRLFYSRNHIYLHPYGFGLHPWHRVDEINPFIKRLPMAAITHLRSLQFVIQHGFNWLDSGTRYARDWREVIEVLARHAHWNMSARDG